MGKFYDLKRKGLCTKCGERVAEGKRMILCGVCRDKLKAEHSALTEAHKQYNPDVVRKHTGERG